MHDRPPNGWFLNDLIIFLNLANGGYASKGFKLDVPELRNQSEANQEAFMLGVRNFLASFNHETRLQIQWSVNSNYRMALNRYQEETVKYASHEWTKYIRNERFIRYSDRVKLRDLRREELHIYCSKKIAGIKKSLTTDLLKEYENTIAQIQTEMDEYSLIMRQAFGAGTRVHPLTDQEHFLHYHHFLNPSIAENSDFDFSTLYDPHYTLQELSWNGDGVPTSQTGFKLDGFYHHIFTLKRWPSKTRACLFHRLTSLPFLDYSITVNIDPLTVYTEIEAEEKRLEQLKGSYLSEGKHSQLTKLKGKQRKIDSLAEGYSYPFHVNYVVRAWAKDEKELFSKVAAIKNAVNSMNGAQLYENALPTSAKKIFFSSWPGWCWSSYEYQKLYAEDTYLADMLPFSSTFVGFLDDNPEAIYEGTNKNLVGIKTFVNNTPQHMAWFGMSRAGKSVNLADLLAQSELYFAYTAFIEEGLSHGVETQLYGENPIIIKADGEDTINYFDTNALPLNETHITTITSLVAGLIGRSESQDRQQIREANIAEYIQQVYRDRYREWSQQHYQLLPEIARLAVGIQKYKKEKAARGATSLECYADLRDWLNTSHDEAQEFMSKITEGDLTQVMKDPTQEKFLEATAYSFFKPQDYPTHTQLYQMMLYDPMDHHNREEINGLASLLATWTNEGPYGKLFDGITNVKLKGKITHFELGDIPEHAITLKAAAGLLISSYVRQHIISMPRSLRKRIIFEEVARFKDIPGGPKIVRESYAQLGKFNCVTTSVIQQYANYKGTEMESTILGNTSQFFIMRQVVSDDIQQLGAKIQLPETTQNAIMNYPMPAHIVRNPYSSFCYYSPVSEPPIVGTIHNHAAKEMLYASSSTGNDFEKRSKQLKKEKSIFEGVKKYANEIL